jgi:hypothetical protein
MSTGLYRSRGGLHGVGYTNLMDSQRHIPGGRVPRMSRAFAAIYLYTFAHPVGVSVFWMRRWTLLSGVGSIVALSLPRAPSSL